MRSSSTLPLSRIQATRQTAKKKALKKKRIQYVKFYVNKNRVVRAFIGQFLVCWAHSAENSFSLLAACWMKEKTVREVEPVFITNLSQQVVTEKGEYRRTLSIRAPSFSCTFHTILGLLFCLMYNFQRGVCACSAVLPLFVFYDSAVFSN